MAEKSTEHEESKVVSMAEHWLDTRSGKVGKSGDELIAARAKHRKSEHALAGAVCDLRAKRNRPP